MEFFKLAIYPTAELRILVRISYINPSCKLNTLKNILKLLQTGKITT